MHWKYGALLVALAVLVTGCKLSTDVPTRPVGVIRLSMDGDSQSGFTTSPDAAFMRVQSIGLPSSGNVVDSCKDSLLVREPDEPLEGNIGAGASIEVTTDKGTGALAPSPVGAGLAYELAGLYPIPLTPGTDVSFTIPGDPQGFPALTLKAATVTPFTFGPIPTDGEDQLRLTWSPVQGPGYALVVSMEYSSSPDINVADRQIYCSLIDKGSFALPSDLAELWKKSSPSARRVTAYRWVTSAMVQEPAVIIAIAKYSTTKTTFP